jgi:flagellar biosynthetic protein FliR
VGSALTAAVTGPLLIQGTGQMLLAAVQIAGPLIVVLFLADVGMGLLTRVAPALNAFALSFPLKVLLTLVLAVTTFVGLPAIVESLTGDALELMGGAR